jgi:MerR family transcriptional regulator, thiopeptide resistance regulator
MNLSPTETATRFGVSIKALRLYESRGLLKPLRSHAGWRTYGPDQVARLHQILALKRLGLPLARIATILAGTGSLDPVLELQEQILAREGMRLAGALELVRAARAKLRSGQSLSVDDLATLTQETVMTSRPDAQARAAFEKIFASHFTPEEQTTIRTARAAVLEEWKLLQPRLEAVMAAGDPTTPAARAIATQCRDVGLKVTGADAGFRERFRKFRDDVGKNPEAGGLMLLTPDMRKFLKRALAAD